MTSFTREFDTPVFKGKVDFPTGVYINGKFAAGSDNTTIKYAHALLLRSSIVSNVYRLLITVSSILVSSIAPLFIL